MASFMMQLSRFGLKNLPARKSLNKIRSEYRRTHAILIENFVEPAFLDWIKKKLDKAVFYDRNDGKISREATMRQNEVFNALQFMANQPEFLRLVKDLTSCKPARSFIGRLYRFSPGSGHYDSWHSDVHSERPRLVAMSVNLSQRRYQGAAVEIRDKKTQKIITKIKHKNPGDCLLFRISPDIEHRVAPLRGKEARTVFVGWFSSTEDGIKPFFKQFRSPKKQFDRKFSGTNFSARSRFTIRETAVSQKSSSATLLLNTKTHLCFRLNESAQDIWNGMARGQNLDEIASDLKSKYSVDGVKAMQDIRKLAAKLAGADLVELKTKR